MTALHRTSQPRRIDAIAAAWGGLVGGLGLVIAGPRDLAVRIGIIVIAGVIAGFLTGMRAMRHRLTNAALAWAVANLFYWAFVVVANVVHAVSGRRAAPAFLPGGPLQWAMVTAIGLAATLLGGAIANLLLRPASRRSTYS